MAFGITLAGYVRKTFTDITGTVFPKLRGGISAVLDLSERDPFGNAINIILDEISTLHEHAEVAYQAGDVDNADPNAFRALCLLSGVQPGGADFGRATVTLDLDAGVSFAAGDMVANVVGEPSNLWENEFPVTSTTAGTYTAIFVSQVASSEAVAVAGSLSEITAPLAGWNSITNPTDADEGRDVESIPDLRARRDAAIAITGTGTVPAIASDVGAVTGVISAKVLENTTDVMNVELMPAHSFRVVVWDGPSNAADDDDIAQAVFDSKTAGITITGALSGTAVAANGQLVTVPFSRATQVEVEVAITVQTDRTVDTALIKQAVVDSHNEQTGQDVSFNHATCSVLPITGVLNWTVATMNVVGQPAASVDVPISSGAVGLLDTSRVTVTVL